VRIAVSKTVLLAIAFVAGLGGLAKAQDLRVSDMQASYAAVGEVTRTPYGWADLCGRQPQECRVDVLDAVDLHLTPKTLQILKTVNAKVNAEIEPVSNMDHWGTMLDHWDYPSDGKGDCKIYALWKRKLLMDIGFPRQALLMTIVRDLEGNGHTILTVKTDRGDFVLDNMVGEIRAWDATGYSFVKRQTQADPNVWVSVGPSERRTMASNGILRGIN
jgi:predicted transglutaminase-like cysteine proteinase